MIRKAINIGHKILTTTLWWGATFAFSLSLLVAGVLVRLAYKPYDLAPHMAALEDLFFIPHQGGVEFDKLYLHFDGYLSVQGEGVLILGADKKPLATARTFALQLAHSAFFKGQIAFRKVLIDGLALRAEQDSSGLWYVGESFIRPQPESTQTSPKTPAFVQALAAIKAENGAFSYLEAFSLKNTMAIVGLRVRDTLQEWQILNTDLEFSQINGYGFEVESTGVLAHKNAKTSFSLRADKQKKQHGRLRAHIAQLDEIFLKTLLPEDVQESFYTLLDGADFSARLKEDDFSLMDARFVARLGETTLNLPHLYPEVKKFRSGNITLAYKPTDAGNAAYTVEDFILEDAQGLMLTAEGAFTPFSEKKTILADMTIRINEAPLVDIIAYLPPKEKATQGLVTWLEENTNHKQAYLRDITLKVKGDLKEARLNYKPTEERADFLRLGFTFHNLDARVHPRLDPIVGINGHATLEGDVLHISAPEGGQLKGQTVTDLDVIISDLGQKDKPTTLRGHARFNGVAQGLLPIVEDLFQANIPITEVAGQQTSVVDIVLPLNENLQKELQFSSETTLQETAFLLPQIEKPFRAAEVKISATDQTLKLTSQGEVQFIKQGPWWKTQLLWSENLDHFGAQTHIEANITSQGQFTPQLLATLKGEVQGTATHKVILNKSLSEGAWYQFDVTSHLTPVKMALNTFGWGKEAGEALNFNSTGRLHPNGQIEAEVLEMRGQGVDVLGRGYANITNGGKNLDNLTLHFDTFILGPQNNAEVLYGEDAFRLTGETFFFDGFGAFAEPAQKMGIKEQKEEATFTEPVKKFKEDISLRDGPYDIRLKQLTFKGGVFYDILANILRENNHWEKANIEARVGENKEPFTLTLRAQEGPQAPTYKQVEVFSSDAGAALKALGIYQNMKDGQLEVLFNIEREYSPFGLDGTGHMMVENAFVQNAPTLVRLLSLVSLEQIASANQGIAFKKIHFPLAMENRTLFIEKGLLKGPNIALTLEGSADFATEELNLQGALTPASGINSILGKIPLLGPLLTGSQGALIVADFTMKGPMAQPEISANPLSAVTPGILKDIFGGLFGDGPPKPSKKNEEPKPTELK